ncbi:MAG: hypothetical protein LCH81_10525 [Bacteroidetes bacterium]|nr:hypothetical protein [Bacteroidota bacterium]
MKHVAFSMNTFIKNVRPILMAALFFLMAHTLSAGVLFSDAAPKDSLLPRLPCYPVFQKEVIKTALSASANARSIESGVVNYIRQFAFLNRKFYICMRQHYPNGKK